MEHLPPWLRNVPLPARPPGRAEPPAAGAADLPSWLVELQGELGPEDAPGAAPGEAPDWLSDLAAEQGPAQGAPARPEPFAEPGWLSEPPPEQAPPEQPAEGEQQTTSSRVKMPRGATDWLRSIGQDPDARSEPLSEPVSTPEDHSGIPEWLRDLSADEIARGIEADTHEEQPRPDAPDWLAEGADEDARPLSEDAEAEVPAWLREAVEPAADEGARLPSEDVEVEAPAWLREAAEPAADEAPPRQPEVPADLAADEEVPAWLRDLDEQPAAPEPPPEEDAPAWLRAADEASPAAPAEQPAGDDEMPSWLRESAPSAGPGSPAPSDAAPPPASDVPAWLQEPVETPPPPASDVPAWLQEPAETPPPPAASDVPAWLQDTGGEIPSPPAASDVPAWLQETGGEPPPPAASDVPAWLQETGGEPPPPPASDVPAWLQETGGETPPPPVASDVPAWLQETGGETPPPPPPAASDVPAWLQETGGEPALAASDVPAWLQDTGGETPPPPPPAASDVPAWLQDTGGETPPPPPPAASDVPPWLQETGGETPPPPPASADVPPWLAADAPYVPEPGAIAPADPGLPSWLRGVEDEPPPSPPSARPAAPRPVVPGADQSDSHSFLSGAELPPWLRVPEPERPAETSEDQAFDWLRRLGSSDQEDEPLPAAVAVPPPQRPEYQRSAEQVAAANLLRQIAQMPYPEPVAPAAPAPRTRWQRIGLDRALYAIFALALLVALLVPAATSPFQTTTPEAPGAAELGALLDSLGPDDVALVAYEWGAQRSGELRPLEDAVTRRLIANRVKLILVSTDLQGTLLSFDLIGPMRAAGYNTENGVSLGGRDYVLLGYRPGGELALRALAQDLRGQMRSDFDGQDATQGLVANYPDGTPRFNSISDLSLIVVMADQPQDVQAWMEQVRPAAGEVPMVFLLPQEAQPLAQPFLRMRNVYHASGQQGALALLGSDATSDPAAVARATGQLWYAVAVFLLLLVVGGVAALIRRRPARGGGA